MKDDSHNEAAKIHYVEFIGDPPLPRRLHSQAPDDMVWHTETMHVDSFHEAFEWIMSGAFNEIGYLYTGYQTTNWMLAHVLVLERIRLNTMSEPKFQVHADYDFTGDGILYKVWVTPL